MQTTFPSGNPLPEDIQKLVKFLHISELDWQLLKQLEPFFQQEAENVARSHYDELLKHEDLRALIDRHSTVEQLTVFFQDWIKSIPSSQLDTEYIASRKRIGHAHARIGLPAAMYLGTFARLFERLLPAIVRKYRWKPV